MPKSYEIQLLRKVILTSRIVLITLATPFALVGLASGPFVSTGQSQTPAANSSRVVGTVTAVASGTLTVKTDAGAERKVTVPDGIKLQRIAPGEKDLSQAATIQFSDIAIGDRVLVRLAPDPATDPVTAISIIAIPQADLAQKQQKDREDWQRNGVGGLVKSVDAGTGIILVTSGAGPAQKTITLHTTPATVLRRYASDSVNFDQAKPAPLEVIKPGDQLRARGTKNPDGTEIAAVDVVSGSFRNIAGTIASINASTNTVTLKDLSTKQTVNVRIGPDTQMRKLPEEMAKMLASSAKGAGGAGSGAAGHSGGADATAAGVSPTQPRSGNRGAGTPGGTSPANDSQSANAPSSNPSNGGPPAGGDPSAHSAGAGQSTGTGMGARSQGSGGGADSGAGRRGGGDPQQMLARAPQIHLSDLQKGDAIMLVSTEGTTDVSAITLLAGVEPLLQAPASTQNMLLSGWNMSSGGGEAAQ